MARWATWKTMALGLGSLSLLCVLTLGLGCGDDDDDNGEEAPECTDYSGTYTFSEHCQTAWVGQSFVVTQVGCAATSDWGGEMPTSANLGTDDGTFEHVVHVGGGVTVTCTTEIEGGTVTSECDQVCHVVAQRD